MSKTGNRMNTTQNREHSTLESSVQWIRMQKSTISIWIFFYLCWKEQNPINWMLKFDKPTPCQMIRWFYFANNWNCPLVLWIHTGHRGTSMPSTNYSTTESPKVKSVSLFVPKIFFAFYCVNEVTSIKWYRWKFDYLSILWWKIILNVPRSCYRKGFRRRWERFGFSQTHLKPIQSIQDRKCQFVWFAMQNHRTLSEKSRTACNKYDHGKCYFNQSNLLYRIVCRRERHRTYIRTMNQFVCSFIFNRFVCNTFDQCKHQQRKRRKPLQWLKHLWWKNVAIQ